MAFVLDEASRRRLVDLTERAARLFGSPKPVMEAMGLETLAWINETFREGGRPKWEPLRPSTLAGRRQGRGSGASQGTPLRDTRTLQASFQVKSLTDRRVEVGTDDPRGVWHNFGTRPYVIRPKEPGGVLAFAAVMPGEGGGIVGQRTLAGLGRARRTASGSFIVPAGRTVRGRQGGQRIAPFKNVQFAKAVHHPGLPARRMLPTPDQITQRLVQVATHVVQQAVRRA